MRHYVLRVVAIGKPERHTCKASHCGSKQQQCSHAMITLLLLVRATYVVLFVAHIPFAVNHMINAMLMERLQQHPLLFTTNRTDCTFFLRRFHTQQPPHPGQSTTLLTCLSLCKHASWIGESDSLCPITGWRCYSGSWLLETRSKQGICEVTL